MKENITIKKYVEIYEGMKIGELSKSLNISEEYIIENIGHNNPSFEDLMCIVEMFDYIPICLQNIPMLNISIERFSQNNQYIPCISIMGHINHGKSSLVGALINEDICSKEAGKITQNVSLYNFKKDDVEFVLIDTPGHSILDNMRNVIIPLSEVIIIIVAANVGPEQQTFKIIEQTNHKDRILCLNKIDANNLVNEDYIYSKCASYGLACNVLNEHNNLPVVKVSSKNNLNIKELIDEISNMIKKQQYKTDLYRPAVGYIIDAFVTIGKGRLIRILLKAGMCKIGDSFCLNGNVYTINRMFKNGLILSKKDEYVSAGCFVDIVCEAKCQMGDLFFIINNKNMQNTICNMQINNMDNTNKAIADQKFSVYIQNIQQHNLLINILPKNSIIKITMHANITKDDIVFCKENNSRMIIWFKISNTIQDLLNNNEIKYIASPNLVIGEIDDFLKIDVKEEIKEEITGTCAVKAIFYMKKHIILGSDVKSGKIILGNKCIVKRNDVEVCRGTIRSLEHNRESIEDAKMGLECGLILKDISYTSEKSDFVIGDIIECIK